MTENKIWDDQLEALSSEFIRAIDEINPSPYAIIQACAIILSDLVLDSGREHHTHYTEHPNAAQSRERMVRLIRSCLNDALKAAVGKPKKAAA
jgi:hypothetical protein